jgi:hypothetical protein
MTFLPAGEGVSSVGTTTVFVSASELPENDTGTVVAEHPRQAIPAAAKAITIIPIPDCGRFLIPLSFPELANNSRLQYISVL